jgi:hypothetical protein
VESCQDYFLRNPYDNWFKKLDYIISGTSISYYFPSERACHLDLIPYATINKWTELTAIQRSNLIDITGDTLGHLLKNSPVEVIILNGKTVVDNITKIANIELKREFMNSWELPRKSGNGIAGYSYKGIINSICGVDFNKEIMVLGYNHNIQSSYGVTTQVQTEIRNWITEQTKFIL